MGDRDSANVVDMLPRLRALARTLGRSPVEADRLVERTLLAALASFDGAPADDGLWEWLSDLLEATAADDAKSLPPQPNSVQRHTHQ